MTEIRVNEVANCEEIHIVINDIQFSAEVIDKNKNTLMFWITPDIADKLAFHINAILEDRQRAKDKKESS